MSNKKAYVLEEDSPQHQFANSRHKIQLFGGAFANGKTTAVVIKALKLARDYPGSNGLIARETYPKLRDTIMRVVFEWMPSNWIEHWSKTESTLTLKNGSTINFRYIVQQGKNAESSTSNLLSATYDWIIVDQIEDPGITHKDFLDLVGRLRGNTEYVGDDPTMPKSGPRWLITTCNPTRNWVYKKIVQPVHQYRRGVRMDDLLVDKNGEPIIDLIEGSTYTNARNLAADYIEGMEATYQGQMRERFLLGRWGAFEGLVYPDHSDEIHAQPTARINAYRSKLRQLGIKLRWVEGFDFGLAAPSCYLCGFVDHLSNVVICGGFYKAGLSVDVMSREIIKLRRQFEITDSVIYADPSLMRRGPGGGKVVGRTVAEMFSEYGITLVRGNSNIMNGVKKVQSYLATQKAHRNPFTDQLGAPLFYYDAALEFLMNEFNNYMWQRNTSGEFIDTPTDRNDHAMDTIKYLLSKRPPVGSFVMRKPGSLPSQVMTWHEFAENKRAASLSRFFTTH